MTVVLITHHMDEAAQADRLVVMAKGRVVADGTPREVFSAGGGAEGRGPHRARDHRAVVAAAPGGVDVPLDALSDEECAQALFDLLQTRACTCGACTK